MVADVIINNTKRTHTGEIIVTLFELCDINCLFCNQDHTSTLGIDTIPDKIHQIVSSIETLKQKGKTDFAVKIMGGEVFSDQLPDGIFDEYVKLISSINEYSTRTNTPIKLSFVTNFIWTKSDRVKRFVVDNDILLFTSYDPSGRFNVATLEIFQDNVVEFVSHIRAVNVIMTKPNIDKFMRNQIPFFDYLYDHFDIYFDYYTPESNMNVLLPKDIELRDFMIHMYDTWPKCSPFRDFESKQKANMSCMDTFTIMPDSNFGRCDILLKGVIPIKLIPMKKDLEQEWLDSYNCLECQHFSRCSLGCFLSNHIKEARTQKECWLEEVYNYVDDKWT